MDSQGYLHKNMCLGRNVSSEVYEQNEDSFNIHFGKLSGSEKARNLEIAKAIPFELNMTIDKALNTSPDLKALYEEDEEAENQL